MAKLLPTVCSSKQHLGFKGLRNIGLQGAGNECRSLSSMRSTSPSLPTNPSLISFLCFPAMLHINVLGSRKGCKVDVRTFAA